MHDPICDVNYCALPAMLRNENMSALLSYIRLP